VQLSQKGIRLPTLAEDRIVPRSPLAEILGGEGFCSQLPNRAKLVAVFLFSVPQENNSSGARLGHINSWKSNQGDKTSHRKKGASSF
jgi:hypothetical protein